MDRLAKEGLEAERAAQDLQPCYDAEGAAEYAAKGVLELAHGWVKEGKNGSLHPFELASRAASGDREAGELFREYAAVMPGTPQGKITSRLAEALGIDPADDQEQPAEDEPEESEDVIGTVAPVIWDRAVRHGYVAELLHRVELGQPWEAIMQWLHRALPPPPSPLPRTQYDPVTDSLRVGAGELRDWTEMSFGRANGATS